MIKFLIIIKKSNFLCLTSFYILNKITVDYLAEDKEGGPSPFPSVLPFPSSLRVLLQSPLEGRVVGGGVQW